MRTQEYESIYKAGIEVASNPTRHVSSSRRKRNDEDDDDSEDGRCVLSFACVRWALSSRVMVVERKIANEPLR